MSGVNKVILVGRLGKDPEVKNMNNGDKVANFSMATSETWKDKITGDKKEATEWHNIVLWRGLAEIAGRYLHKGDMIYIEGKLKTRSWEKEGITRYATEIIADNMTMLSTQKSNSSGGEYRGDQVQEQYNSRGREETKVPPPSSNNVTDDLPF